MQSQFEPLVLVINAACYKFAVSHATIYRLAKAGTIEFVKIGKGSTRVTDASLRKALAPKIITPD